MKTRPTKKQIIAGTSAIALLLASIVAKEIVVAKHGPASAAGHQRSPIQVIIDLDAHHFREIRAHQQLWDPTDKQDVRTIAELGKRYHAHISRADLSTCPKAFQTAYKAHVQEWNGIATALLQATNTSADGDNLAAEVRQVTKPLETTWAQVRSTAREAGVFVRD